MTAYPSQTLVSEKITLNRNGGNQPSTAMCMIMWTSLSSENEVDILALASQERELYVWKAYYVSGRETD